MKTLLTIILLTVTISAQEADTVFTAKDSIIVEDFKQRIEAFEKYQEQLKKEYESSETIKNYLINSKAILENKKNGKRK